MAEENGLQRPNNSEEENSTTTNKQDTDPESKNKKRTEENDSEKVEVDEFGRMLRRDCRQRDDDYDHSDHSDYDRYRSESRRYSSSSIRSSRRRSSEDYSRSSHYHSRNDYGRQLHYDRYVPSRSSHHRHSDSDREDQYRHDDRFRDRKRSRTWSRRSSDSEEEYERSSRRRRRSFDKNDAESRRWSNDDYEDQYQVASKYIDTEFYSKKIYVGELKDVTERALHMAFERFGDIENIDMVSEKGIAFIDFDTEENATEARRKMDGTMLGSGYIQVNRAKRPERNLNGFGNVPWSDADGTTANQNDIKQIAYGIQYSFQTSPYVNNPSEYSSTVNRTVPIPSSHPPLDPRAQGHKRKIIAYDDL